jgi:hypothetical protein
MERPIENQAPFVRLATEKINLPDSVRLFTRIRLSWSGQDADGFVKGYRMAWAPNLPAALAGLNSAPLQNRTDSVFLFNVASTGDTSTIWFAVQAEDNLGRRSTEPALLRIPLVNSRPVIQFLTDGLPQADTIWSVISLPFLASDPDGSDNIDSVYVKINEGSWTGIPKNLNFISMVPEVPEASGETHALIYSGENLATLAKEPSPVTGIRIPGLRLNGDNRFYLRIKDLAGASKTDSTRSYFIRRKTGDILLLDAVRNSGRDSLYPSIISAIAPYDKLDLNFPVIPGTRVGANQPKFWNSTLYLLCNLYKKVFWYSDILPTNQPAGADTTRILLTPAAPSLNQYVRFKGKLLVSATFPDGKNQLSMDNAAFSLLPVSSFYPRTDTIRIRPNGLVFPRQIGYDSLKILSIGSVVTGVDVFNPSTGADTLFVLPKASLGGYPGVNPLCIAVRAKNPQFNRSNLIFFGMELFLLSADRPKLQQTFTRIFNEEFSW